MRSKKWVKVVVVAGLALGLWQCGDADKMDNGTMAYEEILQEAAAQGTVAPGSVEEAAAIARFSDFISVLSPDRAREKTAQVYAADAYLNDTLKEVRGAAAIEAYFVESLAATDSVWVEVTDVAQSQGNYYFRWIMHIRFKNIKAGQTTSSIGMSHIRFDRQGKVVLHQDYWDSATGFYQHLPVIGRLINWVKSRL